MSALTRRVPRPSARARRGDRRALHGARRDQLRRPEDHGQQRRNAALRSTQNRSLGGNEMKKNTLDGDEINEAALGTVPKAADADTVGGQPASSFMVKQTRGSRPPIPADQNFANNAVVGTLADLAPGTYVVTAKLTYDNDGATATSSPARCTCPAATTRRRSPPTDGHGDAHAPEAHELERRLLALRLVHERRRQRRPHRHRQHHRRPHRLTKCGEPGRDARLATGVSTTDGRMFEQ